MRHHLPPTRSMEVQVTTVMSTCRRRHVRHLTQAMVERFDRDALGCDRAHLRWTNPNTWTSTIKTLRDGKRVRTSHGSIRISCSARSASEAYYSDLCQLCNRSPLAIRFNWTSRTGPCASSSRKHQASSFFFFFLYQK